MSDEWPPPDLAEWWAERQREERERMVQTCQYMQRMVQGAVLRYSQMNPRKPKDSDDE